MSWLWSRRLPRRAFLFLSLLVSLGPVRLPAEPAEPLRLVRTIPLDDVDGRLDHLAIDLDRARLFVAALGNDTVEIVDLAQGKRIRTLSGVREPQGIMFIPGVNTLAVTSRSDGTCELFDGESFELRRKISLGADADTIRYDPRDELLYVGYGHGALGVIEAHTGALVNLIRLSGHPESFQLERWGSRLFVNLPDARQVALVDRTRLAVTKTWPLKEVADNFSMALDEGHGRLFVSVRNPAKLLVFDTETGALVKTLDSIGDVDDLFYDRQRDWLYVSGGEGFLLVIARVDTYAYQTLAKLPTAPGARTSLFVPELNQLFVAVPRRGSQGAEIRVYAVES